METKTYIRKPQTVEAVQLSRINQGMVKKWTNGTEQPDYREGHEPTLQVRIISGDLISVYPGDWIVRSDEGIEVFTDWAFRNIYAEKRAYAEDRRSFMEAEA